MAFPTGQYHGYSAEGFAALQELAADNPELVEWLNNFTAVADSQYYIFSADDSGDQFAFIELLEDLDLEDYGMESFTYILSTNSVIGF